MAPLLEEVAAGPSGRRNWDAEAELERKQQWFLHRELLNKTPPNWQQHQENQISKLGAGKQEQGG